MSFPDLSSLPKPSPYIPPSPPSPTPEPTPCAEAMTQCAGFTKQAAVAAFSPKYSMFFNGIRMMCEKDSGGMFSGLGHAMGFVCLLASPLWGLFRKSIGGGAMVGGAVATVFTAIAAGGEWVKNNIGHVFSPSSAAAQKNKWTRNFVHILMDFTNKLTYNQKEFFKNHPSELVNIQIIAVAFLSRDIEGNRLKVGNEILTLDQLEVENQDLRDCFSAVCDIKDAVKSLRLSPNDNHGWVNLMQFIEKLSTAQIEPSSANERNREETLKLILEKSCALSEKITMNLAFQGEWVNAGGKFPGDEEQVSILERLNSKSGIRIVVEDRPSPSNVPNSIANVTSVEGSQPSKSEMSWAFICPITQEIMEHPVMDSEGNNYEYAAIIQWLNEHHTSPITRSPLTERDLHPNRALQALIEDYKKSQS